jgi:RNA polymerase sigma-70 factor (ECF subfamily)
LGQGPNEDFKDRDEELLRAARSAPEGDMRAFEQLVELHRRRILADCQCLTGGDNDSEDLAQEVFVKAYFGLNGFEGRSTFRHWLQRVKVNHCLNHLKRRSGREAVAIGEESAESLEQLQVAPAADSHLEAMEQHQRIDAILASMPSTLRVPLIMRDMDELSYEEIAGSLGIGLSAAKMRIKRAREHFRRLYGEPWI